MLLKSIGLQLKSISFVILAFFIGEFCIEIIPGFPTYGLIILVAIGLWCAAFYKWYVWRHKDKYFTKEEQEYPRIRQVANHWYIEILASFVILLGGLSE